MAAANEDPIKIRVGVKGSGARALEELARNGIKAVLGEKDGALFAEFDLTPWNLRAFANCLDRLEKADKARKAESKMKEELRSCADSLERLEKAYMARRTGAEMKEERRQ